MTEKVFFKCLTRNNCMQEGPEPTSLVGDGPQKCGEPRKFVDSLGRFLKLYGRLYGPYNLPCYLPGEISLS
jgi:hypothetical protein